MIAPFFRKRPANGTNGGPAAKKLKTEESKEDTKEKEELKKQMKKLYYYRYSIEIERVIFELSCNP